ncbi:MAG: hypothetical protein CMP36_03170 [Rickettsiales bacterium]|nr:hypothetical protein [Rickettsiales bacterium]OUV79154.1 MAG: hypothetical protein CBC91_03925 [Rickettsiales bacterium TMED131]|tara:strand:+ start:379 stop:675 length:297 start_codon:yes stop_codon:yes gene_type:complete
MVIQFVTRTFEKKCELVAFEKFFLKSWKNLIKKVPNCKLKILRENNSSFTFNALWEFPNNDCQIRVMDLIKINNKNFDGIITNKTRNFSGKIIKEYLS